MFGWECDPARDERLTIAEYREQFLGKVGHQATISGHMGSKRGTAANLAKVRCTLAQVFDSFAIFEVDTASAGSRDAIGPCVSISPRSIPAIP